MYVVGNVKFSTTNIIVVFDNKKSLRHLKSDCLIHFILYRKECDTKEYNMDFSHLTHTF